MSTSQNVLKSLFILCVVLLFPLTSFADGSVFYKVSNVITGEDRLEEHQHVGEKITILDVSTKNVLYTSECFNERSLCTAQDEDIETTFNHIGQISTMKNRETLRSLVFIKPKKERALVLVGITVTMIQEHDSKWVIIKTMDNTSVTNVKMGLRGDYRKPDYVEHVIINPESGLPSLHEIYVRTDVEI